MIKNKRYKRLLEGSSGGPDQLYAQIEKAKKALEKAQEAVVTAGDELTQVIVESTAIGGSLQTTIPNEIKQRVSELDQIAATSLEDMLSGGQKSLDQIEEILDNTPFRDLKPKSKSDRRRDLSQPDLSKGKQSAINGTEEPNDASPMDESIEDLFRKDNKREYAGAQYFNQIREAVTLGNDLEFESFKGLNLKPQADLIRKELPRIKEKMRAATRDQMFEENGGSHFRESETLNFDEISSLGGNDGMPLNFSSLNDPLKVVGM